MHKIQVSQQGGAIWPLRANGYIYIYTHMYIHIYIYIHIDLKFASLTY